MSVNISNGKLQVFNPATGKEVSVIPMTSSNELQIILQNAKEACDYNLSSLYYRKKLMTRFQKGIVNRMDEFIETNYFIINHLTGLPQGIRNINTDV